VLKDGDIVNIDITIFHDGVHGDCSETVFIGNVSPEVGRIVLIAFADFFYTSKKVRDLVVTTFEAWKASIAICKPGVRYSEIGGVIEDIIKPKGYTSVEEFCGHGIGRVFHTSPNVLHYKNNQRLGIMEPGHTFTIEPMVRTTVVSPNTTAGLCTFYRFVLAAIGQSRGLMRGLLQLATVGRRRSSSIPFSSRRTESRS
jgi:methionyl aminopeptidase